MENTIKFIQETEDTRVEMTTSSTDAWTQVSKEYLRFLNACGYDVTAQDIVDYFSDIVDN